ncbi:glycosyltransferase family 4 protein [Micromonospora maritima]|uniref:glycosyltransferase family 4 protein n=1 Tax=Micromonospora maritima TaxID=986711 RepID=UPI00157D866E|nr:glycosyltransferase family 4 protein [Micromonospora maritima]
MFGALDIGGAELRTIDLLPTLIAAGADVHFVTLSGRAGVLAPDVERLGARVHPLPLDLRFPVRFVRLLRRLRAEVVHSDVATFSGALLLLAAVARTPVRIAHFRSDGDGRADSLRRRLQRRVMRRLIDRHATDIVAVSPGSLTYGYRPGWESDPRCRVIPNGLDLARLARPTDLDLRTAVGAVPGDVVCLHVGRASPEKRRWLLPPAVAALESFGVSARLAFAGAHDAEDDARVRRAAETHRVGDRVRLLGPRDDVGALMRQADVVLLPSDREGLPGVVLEALATGTRVVASDLPGVRFIAEHLPGVTVVARDAAPDEWAKAICEATTGAGADRDVDAAVRAFRSSLFSLDSAALAHLSMYRRHLPAVSAIRPRVGRPGTGVA